MVRSRGSGELEAIEETSGALGVDLVLMRLVDFVEGAAPAGFVEKVEHGVEGGGGFF